MLKLKAALNAVRDLFRKTGFDIVRYNALPTDLPVEIVETVNVVMPFTMTSVHRMAALCEAVQYVARNRIPGDIVECGVWVGRSDLQAAVFFFFKNALKVPEEPNILKRIKRQIGFRQGLKSCLDSDQKKAAGFFLQDLSLVGRLHENVQPVVSRRRVLTQPFVIRGHAVNFG